MDSRNHYTDEYRRETADYIISTGRPVNAVAKELGINYKIPAEVFECFL